MQEGSRIKYGETPLYNTDGKIGFLFKSTVKIVCKNLVRVPHCTMWVSMYNNHQNRQCYVLPQSETGRWRLLYMTRLMDASLCSTIDLLYNAEDINMHPISSKAWLLCSLFKTEAKSFLGLRQSLMRDFHPTIKSLVTQLFSKLFQTFSRCHSVTGGESTAYNSATPLISTTTTRIPASGSYICTTNRMSRHLVTKGMYWNVFLGPFSAINVPRLFPLKGSDELLTFRLQNPDGMTFWDRKPLHKIRTMPTDKKVKLTGTQKPKTLVVWSRQLDRQSILTADANRFQIRPYILDRMECDCILP